MRVPTLLLQFKQHREKEHSMRTRTRSAFHSRRRRCTPGFVHGKDQTGVHPAEDVEDAETPTVTMLGFATLLSCLQ